MASCGSSLATARWAASRLVNPLRRRLVARDGDRVAGSALQQGGGLSVQRHPPLAGDEVQHRRLDHRMPEPAIPDDAHRAERVDAPLSHRRRHSQQVAQQVDGRLSSHHRQPGCRVDQFRAAAMQAGQRGLDEQSTQRRTHPRPHDALADGRRALLRQRP